MLVEIKTFCGYCLKKLKNPRKSKARPSLLGFHSAGKKLEKPPANLAICLTFYSLSEIQLAPFTVFLYSTV
jgi:hypothetical protein